MRLFFEVRERLRALIFRRQEERDMDEELRFHVEMETERLVREGVDREEAARRARIAFGGIERHKEEVRDARGTRWLEDLAQDIGFGWRMLRRRPGFAATAVLTLGIGIAATTTVFALGNAVLFRPIPGVVNQDGLVQVRFRAPHLEDDETGLSYQNLADLQRADLPALEEVVGWQSSLFQVAVPGKATDLVTGAAVQGDYFGALGVRASAGRLFGGDETAMGRAEPVVVLSQRVTRRLFGDGSSPVGSTVTINGTSFAVIGMAGGGFRGVLRGGDADLWIPYGMYPRARHIPPDALSDRQSGHLHDFIVRLPNGIAPPTAETQLREAMARLVAAHPDANARYADYQPTVYEDVGLSPWAIDRTHGTMRLLLAAVALVLVIACANVANLLVFRGIRRRGESAVRQALGGSRARLLRQHLTESGLLAIGGVLAGLALTAWATRILAGIHLPGLPPSDTLPIDGRVISFAVGSGAITVLLAGLVPAFAVHRIELVRSLKDAAPSGTGRHRGLRNGLTLAQIALSMALLVSAVLLQRTLVNLHGVSLGFDPDRVVEVRVNPEPQGYDEARAHRFQRDLLTAAATLPGVDAAGAATMGPLRANLGLDLRTEATQEGWPVEAWGDFVSPGYFDALGVRLLQGRSFTDQELAASWGGSSDVAVVNEALAQRLFGSAGAAPGQVVVERGYRENETLRVVGVVANSRARDLEGPPEAVLYRPLGEHYSTGITLLVRSSAPPDVVVQAVRGAVDRLDPALPFYWAGTVSDLVREITVEPRFLASLMSALAALAALLAGVGLYGIVAYSVAERTHEISIRMALGARRVAVARLVVRQALVLTGGGIAVGTAAAMALARLLESRLFGVEPVDPLSWVLAVLVFALMAVLAAAVPARSAVTVEPTRGLRAV